MYISNFCNSRRSARVNFCGEFRLREFTCQKPVGKVKTRSFHAGMSQKIPTSGKYSLPYTSSSSDQESTTPVSVSHTEVKTAERKRKRNHKRCYSKHPYPYQALVMVAIQSSQTKKMTLSEINEFMKRSFSFSRDESRVWRNFVSSTFSARTAFERLLRDPSNPRKRPSFWQDVLPRVAPAVVRQVAAIEEIIVINNTRKSSPNKESIERV